MDKATNIPEEINITIHEKKPTEEEVRYRFIGQFFITLLCIGFSIYQLVINKEEINSSSLFSATVSGLIMLYVKPPKLY